MDEDIDINEFISALREANASKPTRAERNRQAMRDRLKRASLSSRPTSSINKVFDTWSAPPVNQGEATANTSDYLVIPPEGWTPKSMSDPDIDRLSPDDRRRWDNIVKFRKFAAYRGGKGPADGPTLSDPNNIPRLPRARQKTAQVSESASLFGSTSSSPDIIVTADDPVVRSSAQEAAKMRREITDQLKSEYIDNKNSEGIGGAAYNAELLSRLKAEGIHEQRDLKLNPGEMAARRQRIDDETYADLASYGKRINPRDLAAARRARYAAEGIPPGGSGGAGGSGGGSGGDDSGGGGDSDDAKKAIGSFGSAIALFRVLRGFEMSASTGNMFGKAAGDIARGLTNAITGSASAFASVGDAILSAIMEPWGRAGQAITKGVDGLANGMLKAVNSVGKFAAAGLQAYTAFHAGMFALGGTAIGAVAGGAIGAAVGGPMGAVVGVGLGATAVGYVANIAGQIVSTIGGAIGQMLSAVGTAIGQLGDAISSVISSVISAVRDLVTSAQAFAQTTFLIQRGTGTSMQNSGMIASLSQIATGSPSTFNSMFSGYGMFGIEQRQRAMSMGIDVSGQDFGQYVLAAQQKYRTFGSDEYGSMMKQNLLNVMFPGQKDVFGSLLSLQPQQLQSVIGQARANAPTAQETQQDLGIGMQMNQVDAQLERLKRKFLIDVLPAISKGFDVVAQYFSSHQGAITKSFESIGAWLFVKFPSMLDRASTMLLSFASTFAQIWPQIVTVAVDALRTGLAFFIALAHQLAPIATSPLGRWALGSSADAIGKGLASVGNLKLGQFGLDVNQSMGYEGAAAKESAQWLKEIASAQKDKNTWFNNMGLSASQEQSRANQLAGLTTGVMGSGKIDVGGTLDINIGLDPNSWRTAITNQTARQGVLAFQVANT